MKSHAAAVSLISSKKTLSALALAVAAGMGVAAPSVEAAPYLTVSVVGRVQGSGAPLSSSVVVGAGDVVEYEIRVQLGAEDSVNPYAGATATSVTTTISNWVPSNGSTSPTSGLNSVRLHLQQESTPGTVQADFDNPAVPASGWADAPGNNPGDVTPRGNGNDDLYSINLIRAAGNFDGVAGTPGTDPVPAVLELLTVATGVFDIASAGTASILTPSITGAPFVSGTVLAVMRWRNDAQTTGFSYAATVLHQTNSTTGTAQGNFAVDPIIVYQGLSLVPEPAGVSAIALAALGMGMRRRRG